jgi:hypothetical protein
MKLPTKARAYGPFKTLLFSAILIIMFFAVAEMGVRVWVYFFRTLAERVDIASGTFVPVPGIFPRINAPPVQVNSRGFVGPEFDEPRSPGVKRLVAQGDSCTFGQWAGVETYPPSLHLGSTATSA